MNISNSKTSDMSVELKMWHSPAEYAPAGHGHAVAAVIERKCGIPEASLPEMLTLEVVSANGEKHTLRMSVSDSYLHNEHRFEFYTATIPAAYMVKGTVKYSIYSDGLSGEYSIEAVDLPAPPPFIITEICLRPNRLKVSAYLELYNFSNNDADLYDYEFYISNKDNNVVRIPLSMHPGENIIHSGEKVIYWPLLNRNFGVGKPPKDYCTPQDFCDAVNKTFSNNDFSSSPEDMNLLIVDLRPSDTEKDAAPTASIYDFPFDYKNNRLSLIPRGADEKSALYSLDYNVRPGANDTPVGHASIWTVDLRTPSSAVLINRFERIEPGISSRGQAYFSPDASLPVIMPLSDTDAIYIGDEKHKIAFAALPTEAMNKVAAAYIVLHTSNGDIKINAYENDDGIYYAELSNSIVEHSTSIEYSIVAFDGTREVKLADRLKLPVFDNAGPRIIDMLPTSQYAYDGNREIEIFAYYYDVSGVKLSDCRLIVDGKDVSKCAEWTDSGVKYRPVNQLDVKKAHTVKLELYDNLGNCSSRTVDFTVSDMKELNLYRGEVHCHTSNSDGSNTPDVAYAYARDIGGVDYFAVTDHSHYLGGEYDDIRKTADKFDDPGKFAALFGYEMTWNNSCGYWGHMNVLGSKHIEKDIYNTSLPMLYEQLKNEPNAIAMFNHPGLTWGTFGEYAFHDSEIDKKVCLSEIRSLSYNTEYARILAAGWHAGPVFNDDCHTPTWTTTHPMTGYVLAPSLTRENVMDAFRSNRTYTASEPTLKIKYRVNGQWLGSHLNAPEQLDFDISVTTEKETGIGLIEIVAEDNIVVATKNVGALKKIDWKLTLLPDFDYYYVRIVAHDQYSVTSPVWVENRRTLKISSVELGASDDPDKGTAVKIGISNDGKFPAKNIRADFYLTPEDGFDITDTEPFASAHCGKMSAGATLKVTRSFPELKGMRRLSVVVSAELVGSGRASSVTTTYFSPISITEVLPASDPITVDGNCITDPFPYITLFNSSPKPFVLGKSVLELWTKIGKKPNDSRVWTVPVGTVIEPRSGLVIWVRRNNDTLTVDDFNSRYGTSLELGKDIVICPANILSRSEAGRILDLVTEGDIMSRVWWNFGSAYDGEAHIGKARRYLRCPGYTHISAPLGLFDPTPGEFDEEQRRAEFATVPTRAEKKQLAKDKKSDERKEKRNIKLKVTQGEATAIAAASAVAAGGIAAILGVIGGKMKRTKK